MIPLLKTLSDRLLNEPVFFLSAIAALAPILADELALPSWVTATAVVAYGFAVRAKVTPNRRK